MNDQLAMQDAHAATVVRLHTTTVAAAAVVVVAVQIIKPMKRCPEIGAEKSAMIV